MRRDETPTDLKGIAEQGCVLFGVIKRLEPDLARVPKLGPDRSRSPRGRCPRLGHPIPATRGPSGMDVPLAGIRPDEGVGVAIPTLGGDRLGTMRERGM